jgi:hypothetical protein
MLLADVFFDVRMFGEFTGTYAIIGQTKSCIYGYTRILSPHVGLVRLYCTHTCGCTNLVTEVHRILEVEATCDFL